MAEYRHGLPLRHGLHEGYLVPQFADGQRARGVPGGDIPGGHLAVGQATQDADGTWRHPTRRAGEVTGWVVCCDCYATVTSSTGTTVSRHPTTWVGPVFTRVPSVALEDVKRRRIYAADEEVAYAAERADVEDAVVDLWRSEHLFGLDAVAEVKAAAEAAAAARRRLDGAVAFARHGRASWAQIGAAVGITRQSAQERWRTGESPAR